MPMLSTYVELITHLRIAIKISPDNPYLFNDERNTYSWRSIRTCAHIRLLHEYIDNETSECLVFEWMDRTLWNAKDENIENKISIFKIVAISCLKGLLAFQKMDGENDYCHAGQFTIPRVYYSDFNNTTLVLNLFHLSHNL